MEEIWKDVPGYEGLYQVSNYGRILSLARVDPHGHKRKSRIITHKKPSAHLGYPFVILSKYDVKKHFGIHRIVLIAFVGPPPAGTESCHNDGNKDNCTLDNLRWDTKANNTKDKLLHGTDRRGEKCPTVKLTERDVLMIRGDTRTGVAIGLDYGIHPRYVSLIRHHRRWSHI